MTFSKARNIGGDLAGSIGDLGTFLPYVIGAITIASLDVTSVLVMFGLMYSSPPGSTVYRCRFSL